MDVCDEPTIRGVSYEEPRDRWRCYHRRFGKPILQIRPSNAAESIVVKNIIWERMSKLLVGFIISWAVFLWLVYVLVFKLKHKK